MVNNANITYGALGPNSSSVLRYFLQSLNYLAAYTNGLPWYSIPWGMQMFGNRIARVFREPQRPIRPGRDINGMPKL